MDHDLRPQHADKPTAPWRRNLHALVGGDAVERVFVAPAAAAQLVLRPPAQLDRRVRPDDLVALLRQLLPMPSDLRACWRRRTECPKPLKKMLQCRHLASPGRGPEE